MPTLLNSVTSNGSGTALDCRGKVTAVVSVSGDFDAGVYFEASIDGGSTYLPYIGKVGGAQVYDSVVRAPNIVRFDVLGITHLRPKVGNYKRGEITVEGVVSDRLDTMLIDSSGTELFTSGNPGNIQLTGSKTLETVVDALAITDTSVYTYADSLKVDSKFIAVYIYSTLDQDVTITFKDSARIISSMYNTFVKSDGTTIYEVTIPADSNKLVVITPEDFPVLRYVSQIQYRIQASVAPTSGSISIVEEYMNR